MDSDRRLAFITAFLCLLFVVTSGSVLAAQLTTGTILGTVKDQSDAVLPGATVTVTNVETGISRATTSGSRGEYRIPALAVGTYQVQATLSGFQTGVRTGITLTVGREAVVDFTLPVGNVAEQVTVSGEAPLVETTTATVGAVVDSQQLRDISLNARSFIELVPLQAGAVISQTGASSSIFGFGTKISIVGTRYTSNSFLLDGADINDASGTSGSVAGTMAGVETVREFRVITNAYDSEYGRHTGGVVSAVTKSGTNQLHGSLFEFLRNDNLDAPRWEDNQSPFGKPEFRRNQFGGSVGGPIFRDRTFFFGSYEGLREGKGLNNVYAVPGQRMRQGFTPTGACTSGCTINAAIKPYLDAWPAPNEADRPDGTARLIRADSRNTDQNFWTARVDHRISDSDSLFGRFTYDKSERSSPRLTTWELSNSKNHFSTLEETHIFSPTLLARTHLSFNRTDFGAGDRRYAGFPYPKFSFSDVQDVPGNIAITGITNTSGFSPSTWGGSNTNPRFNKQNTWQVKEDIFLTAGRHSLKFGGQLETFLYNMRSDFHSAGTFTFANFTDFLNDRVNQVTFTRPGSQSNRSWRQFLPGFYLQDDVQIRQGLTVNLGLRYEFISVPKERYARSATIRDVTEPHLSTVRPEETDTGPLFQNPSLKNFAPRIGIAWDVLGKGKTSIRGGFGVFHDQLLPMYWLVPGNRVFPFYAVSEVFAQDVPVPLDFPNIYFNQRTVLLGSVGRGGPQIDGIEYYISQPAVYKWNFDVEQQIAPDTTVETGYSGTRATHLMRGNLQLNTTPSEIRNGRRYILIAQDPNNPNFNRFRWRITDGTSDYHAFRLSVTKRFSQGFQFRNSYTYSRAIDDGSAFLGTNDFSNDRQPYRTTKERGLSAFDIRHAFQTSGVWNLPGKEWPGVAGKVFGSWSVSGSLGLSTGNPNSITADQPRLGARTMTYVDGPTVELVPSGKLNAVNSNFPGNNAFYVDNTQFCHPVKCLPDPFFQGNVGVGTLIGPGIANLNVTLMKEAPVPWIGESGTLQFRAEFFNLINRVNFTDPETNLFDQNGNPRSLGGKISTTRDSAPSRQIQLALKLIF